MAAAGCWEGELRYSEAMLERDVRNNSAWAQRAFVKLVGARLGRACYGAHGCELGVATARQVAWEAMGRASPRRQVHPDQMHDRYRHSGPRAACMRAFHQT